jgi:hypothetical protein
MPNLVFPTNEAAIIAAKHLNKHRNDKYPFKFIIKFDIVQINGKRRRRLL